MNGIRWSILQKIQTSTRQVFFIFRKTQKIGRENEPSKEKQGSLKVQDRLINPRKLQQWPFALLFTILFSARARCMAWRVNFVRSGKDAQNFAVGSHHNFLNVKVMSNTLRTAVVKLFILRCISSNYRRLIQGVLQTSTKRLYYTYKMFKQATRTMILLVYVGSIVI